MWLGGLFLLPPSPVPPCPPSHARLMSGVSAGGNEEGGAVVFFDAEQFSLVRKVGMPGSVAGLAWHHRLNQIFVGTGES